MKWKLALAFVAVGMLYGSTAFALEGIIPNPGYSVVERTVVVTGKPTSTATVCDVSYDVYEAVIVESGGGPAFKTTLGLPSGTEVKPGSRFNIYYEEFCPADWEFVFIRIRLIEH